MIEARRASRGGPLAFCDTSTIAASAIGRLMRIEYDDAVADLLDDASRPARAFAPDDVTTGFEVGGAARRCSRPTCSAIGTSATARWRT